MKLLSLIYSLITLPIFTSIELLLFILKYIILFLKAISVCLDDFNYILIKYNTLLAIISKRTECNHYTATFVDMCENTKNNTIIRTFECDICKERLQTFENLDV